MVLPDVALKEQEFFGLWAYLDAFFLSWLNSHL